MAHELSGLGDSPSLGPDNARITVVVFGDFQCEYSKTLVQSLVSIREEFGPDLRIVYRHFPITPLHKNALLAAEASEAARAVEDGF